MELMNISSVNNHYKTIANGLVNLQVIGYAGNSIFELCDNMLSIIQVHEELTYDTCMTGDINNELLVNQYSNRLSKTVNQYSGMDTIENYLNQFIECVIYQYHKEYKPNRELNKWIRNQFKKTVIKYCGYVYFERGMK